MKRYLLPAVLALTLLSPAAVATEHGGPPRQVILIIGDGMDEHQITIARNYLVGAAGELLLDSLPLRGTVQVLTAADTAAREPVYVADSANTATSIATGAITSRGRLGTAAGTGEPITNIVELAEAAGYRTGVVSTASVTDATPAAFAVHINFRLCENPTQMERVVYRDIELGDCRDHLRANGGSGSVAEQLADSQLDVILGGGRKHFAPAVEGGGGSVLARARDNGFHTVADAAGLAAAPRGPRLLGLFADSHLPVRLRGEDGRSAEKPSPSLLHRVHRYLGSVSLPEPMRCEPEPAYAGTPSLKTLTEAALAHLAHDNDRGFLLVVESASIDKQAHERRPCGSIGEMAQLEEALASALAFAETRPETLVLVTADHSQAAQLIPEISLFAAYPIPHFTPGHLARIITPEGGTMAVNYATTNFFREEHTGAAVPVYGNAAALGRVPPYLRQPELFQIMRNYLGI
jgi:alkaline phosphatase